MLRSLRPLFPIKEKKYYGLYHRKHGWGVEMVELHTENAASDIFHTLPGHEALCGPSPVGGRKVYLTLTAAKRALKRLEEAGFPVR